MLGGNQAFCATSSVFACYMTEERAKLREEEDKLEVAVAAANLEIKMYPLDNWTPDNWFVAVLGLPAPIRWAKSIGEFDRKLDLELVLGSVRNEDVRRFNTSSMLVEIASGIIIRHAIQGA
ncbi:hypothetical protein AYL99_11590 [Fonsecaea erecta]|uniref:Uncharacterized protein n=1 Tax=Fonsecaea erecta TaxID=1367422 RepID=A0A178Z3L4_9EURO|nr:hypothetical protein AYL99_11590 [Fonsecaea erecta]OAP54056.1 hypothetical protein AYL99_11590 [Fonsecaea erecta]